MVYEKQIKWNAKFIYLTTYSMKMTCLKRENGQILYHSGRIECFSL